MIFKLYGIVRWKGKKIANGIDGRFETKDERIANILRMKGIEEIKEPSEIGKPVIVNSIAKESKRVAKIRKKVS